MTTERRLHLVETVTVTTTKAKPWPRRNIFKVAPSGPWFVPSRSVRGATWGVRWDHNEVEGVFFICPCPKGRELGHMNGQRNCFHVREVNEAEREDGYALRPVGLAGDPGRFVD